MNPRRTYFGHKSDRIPGASRLFLGALRHTWSEIAYDPDTLCIKRTAYNVVTNTGQVFHTAATNKNNTVFLEVVAFTADVRNDFDTVGQTYLATLRRAEVWLLRSCCVYTGCKRRALRAVFERRALALLDSSLARPYALIG